MMPKKKEWKEHIKHQCGGRKVIAIFDWMTKEGLTQNGALDYRPDNSDAERHE